MIQLDKQHLCLWAGVILLGMFSVYSFEAHRAEKAEQKLDGLQTQVQQLISSNQTLQQQTQQQIQQLQTLNQSLVSQLQVQQKKDSQLPPQQLGQRLETITGTTGQVNLEPTGHFDLSATEMLTVVQDLEQVPVLTQELANAQKQFTLEVQAHASDNKTKDAQITELNQKVKTVEADARKSKFKWLAAGILIGYVGRILTIK